MLSENVTVGDGMKTGAPLPSEADAWSEKSRAAGMPSLTVVHKHDHRSLLPYFVHPNPSSTIAGRTFPPALEASSGF